MKFLLALITMCLMAMGSTTVALAEVMEPPPYEGSAALKTVKALAGTWEGTTSCRAKNTAHLAQEGHMHDPKVTTSESGHLQQEWSFF